MVGPTFPIIFQLGANFLCYWVALDFLFLRGGPENLLASASHQRRRKKKYRRPLAPSPQQSERPMQSKRQAWQTYSFSFLGQVLRAARLKTSSSHRVSSTIAWPANARGQKPILKNPHFLFQAFEKKTPGPY